MKSLRAGYVKERESISVADLGTKFLNEHVNIKRKPRTAVGYKCLLGRHVFPKLGSLPAVAVKRADLLQIHTMMSDHRHTANRVLAVVGSMYSFGQKADLVPEGTNPTVEIERYREQGRERYLTTIELKRLGDALTMGKAFGIPWKIDPAAPKAKHVPKQWKGQRERIEPEAAAAIRFLLLRGARLREVLNLKWSEVDQERGIFFLPDSKTGKEAVVLSNAALAVLEPRRGDSGQKVYVFGSGDSTKPRMI